MRSAFSSRQAAFMARLADPSGPGRESGMVVVVPSMTFAPAELAKIVGILNYEERLLYLLLDLRRPDVEIVFPSSLAVEDSIVDYYRASSPTLTGPGPGCTWSVSTSPRRKR